MVLQQPVSHEWRALVSAWLVRSGCLYMLAWGQDCSAWDDSVDWANVEAFEPAEIPDDQFVMTTWHDDQPLAEVFWFAEHCAHHPTVPLNVTLIVHVASEDHQAPLVEAYVRAQALQGDGSAAS